MPTNDTWETGGPVYTATFSAQAITAADTDVFCLTAPSSSRVQIREIKLGQTSDFGDAEAEIVPVSIFTGSTAPSSGSSITPANVNRRTSAPSANADVLGPSATLASTTSATLLYADTVNVAAGWWYRPDGPERPILDVDQRMSIRVGAPADAITVSGTIVFQEVGKTL